MFYAQGFRINARRSFCIAVWLLCLSIGTAQESAAQDTGRSTKYLTPIVAASTSIYAGSILAVNQVWYVQHPRSGFHFFNDEIEWLGLDKAGHALTTYSVSRAGYYLMQLGGLSEKKSAWYGGLYGLLALTPVEVMDGFSSEYGFSMPDMIANVSGTALFTLQQLTWQEQRITPKFSYHPTRFAALNPALLGRNFPERLLKDYNGQTYWLSVNPNSFAAGENWAPRWLNIAIGYGGSGMLRGRPDDQRSDLLFRNYERKMAFYLAPDIDFTRIKVKKKWLRTALTVVSFVKFPAPALMFEPGKGNSFHFYPLYF